MLKNYLIVHQSILPDYYMTVIEVRQALEQQKFNNVKDACAHYGISRSTYYKYKDYIFIPGDSKDQRCANIVLTLGHRAGVLSHVLDLMSKNNASILTISQSLPINGQANVMLSVDISELNITIDHLIEEATKIDDVIRVELISIE